MPVPGDDAGGGLGGVEIEVGVAAGDGVATAVAVRVGIAVFDREAVALIDAATIGVTSDEGARARVKNNTIPAQADSANASKRNHELLRPHGSSSAAGCGGAAFKASEELAG